MSLTENSNQVFLPAVREHDSFSYAIYKVIICNFVKNVTYVTMLSKNISHRCLQLMFTTRSNIISSNNFIDTFVKYFISLVFCLLPFSMLVG